MDRNCLGSKRIVIERKQELMIYQEGPVSMPDHLNTLL